jgi:hypothetical protein
METALGAAISVLCSQAMLTSLGVGGSGAENAVAAAGGAVAVHWILKDGLGEIGKLVFIQRFASQFDSRVKTWKLVGEISSVTGAFVSLLTCIAPASWFLPLASVGGALRAVHYSIWTSVHTTFARIFASQKGGANMVGDIVAKDEAQLSLAAMMGAGVGVSLIALIRHDPAFLYSCYGILAPAQMYCSIKMLKTSHFNVLNDVKVVLLAKAWIDGVHKIDTFHLPTPLDLSSYPGHGFLGEFIDSGHGIPLVQPGLSLAEVLKDTPADLLQSVWTVMMEEKYIMRQMPNGTCRIGYRSDATPRDVIRSLFHAVILEIEKGDYARAHAKTCLLFPDFYSALIESPNWSSGRVFFNDKGIRYKIQTT